MKVTFNSPLQTISGTANLFQSAGHLGWRNCFAAGAGAHPASAASTTLLQRGPLYYAVLGDPGHPFAAADEPGIFAGDACALGRSASGIGRCFNPCTVN